MGDRTLASFPGGRPLRGRHNVVLTLEDDLVVPEVGEGTTSEVVHGIGELLERLARRGDDEVWVIGGGSVYAQLLPYCDGAEVTKFDATLPADTFFPDLDADPSWQVERVVEGGLTAEGVPFRFVSYRRVG
jgi:dihydrofolate reductase